MLENNIFSFSVRPFQRLYGRLDKEPDQYLIEAYEANTLGNCEQFKSSRMFKVTVARFELFDSWLFYFHLR